MSDLNGHINEALITRQAELSEAFMRDNDASGMLTYHNWGHVQNVMRGMRQLIEASNTAGDEAEDLLLASVWHDADYAQGAKGHEERSAELAGQQLAQEGLSADRIGRIQRFIRATRQGHDPVDESEAMMQDADLAHLASEAYFGFYDGLFKELNSAVNSKMAPDKWRQECISFMEAQEYRSAVGKSLWKQDRLKNLSILKAMEEQQDQQVRPDQEQALTKEQLKAIKKERKKDKPKFNAEKGIETMFRVSLRNHINLSRIADDKANTLISVNAIILSIVLSALFPKLDSNPWLVYPGIALILVSIGTIIVSTLSTLPNTTHGKVSVEDVKQKRGNLLFFGNFHSMSLSEYEFGMGELMKDGDYLYGSLTRDLYFLGVVLNRKYKLLRWAYLIFVVGLVICIFLFGWSVMSLAPEDINPEALTTDSEDLL